MQKNNERSLFANLGLILGKAAECLNQISSVYIEASAEIKHRIFRLIFKENLVFENEGLRTGKVSDVVLLMAQIIKDLSEDKNGTSQNFSVLPHQVIPLGFEPRTTTLKV